MARVAQNLGRALEKQYGWMMEKGLVLRLHTAIPILLGSMTPSFREWREHLVRVYEAIASFVARITKGRQASRSVLEIGESDFEVPRPCSCGYEPTFEASPLKGKKGMVSRSSTEIPSTLCPLAVLAYAASLHRAGSVYAYYGEELRGSLSTDCVSIDLPRGALIVCRGEPKEVANLVAEGRLVPVLLPPYRSRSWKTQFSEYFYF